MTRTTLLSLAFLVPAATFQIAHADDITMETSTFQSSKTRAEVRAELDAYRRAGVNPWAQSYNHLRNFKSTLSREQVVAEYLNNREAVAALSSEDGGSSTLSTLRLQAAGRAPSNSLSAAAK